MPTGFRRMILRAGGALLVALGVLHLAVTPILDGIIRGGLSAESGDWLVAPMLLNHVVVGILLLPLGTLTFFAAPHAAAGIRWALVVARVTAVTVATLPMVLFALMGAHYFGALPFLVATAIVCVASILLLVAAFGPGQNMEPT